MNARIKKEDFFTLPNILTYFRLICVPIFIVIFFSSFKYAKFVALGVFAVAELTDIIDGKIARKYNLITDLGKVIDPLADKLLQVSTMICLTISGDLHIAFAILLGVKECIMIICGILFFVYNIIGAANVWGKKAASIIGYSMLAVFFHEYIVNLIGFPLDWVFIGIGIVVAYIALMDYGVKAIRQLKDKRISDKEKIDLKY